VSEKTNSVYVGMTKNKLSTRLIQHKFKSRKGTKSPLYDCMRKYGEDNFIFVLRDKFETIEECQEAEIYWIKFARENNWKLLNLADGGNGGYVIPEDKKENWKLKLSKARQGRQPSLGLKHTEENKKYFSECSKRRKLLYPTLNVLEVGFKEAKETFGISKTHYYRLLKRAKANDLS
jgi:group I intron endonuclease